MDNKTMLERAAKAAGIVPYRFGDAVYPRPHVWNPLDDDGDAMRLACDLCIDLDWSHSAEWQRHKEVQAYSLGDGRAGIPTYSEPHDNTSDSKRQAARRAIVRAAAAMAKGEA